MDGFELIIGAQHEAPVGDAPWSPARIRNWAAQQKWIMLDVRSNTGHRLAAWLKQHRWEAAPAMELDNFEVIIHLVAMGLGASLVPRRALAAYPRKKALLRVPLKQRFEREIVILTRRSRVLAKHVRELIEGVLFS